jgi:metallo-beta-lactamase family protein
MVNPRRNTMKIRFIGPLNKVTGSCTWLRDEVRGWNFLVDCGLQQGERTAQVWNRCEWAFEPSALQFVVLTHAHIDHCGLIPMLYKQGFKGVVYCAKETAEIATILLRDAARIGKPGYSEKDVDAICWHEPASGSLLGHFHPVDRDLFLRFFRSGHVMGAMSVVVYWGAPGLSQRSIAFSGDVGPNVEDDEQLPFLRHRMGVGANDFAVVESTYGGTVRDPQEVSAEERRARLRQLVDDTIDRCGSLIIPAFSLGRIQDVLFDLHWLAAAAPERYRDLACYLDAPAAKKIHAVVLRGLQRTESNGRNGKVRPVWLGKQMFRWFGLDDKEPSHVQRVLDICAMTLTPGDAKAGTPSNCGNALARAWRPVLRPLEDRKQLDPRNGGVPSVFIVSSGTCDGGPAVHWLSKLLGDENTTVAMSGFCAPATVGGQLLALASTVPDERRRLTGMLAWTRQDMPLAAVRARIVALSGYSAHADQVGLVGWLFRRYNDVLHIAGKTVFIQHGGEQPREQLAAAIVARAAAAEVTVIAIMPDDPEAWFDLERDGAQIAEETRRQRLQEEIERLQRELDGVLA